MKIGILGTRGIPNHYGGFEQFAEQLSVDLVKRGHDVTVYNSHKHPYQNKEYKGVTLIHCFDPEHKIGSAGQFIYDFNCIVNSRKQQFDILLQLGYTSSSVWKNLLPKKTLVITNMDGLEWKRSKYSEKVKRFLKIAEKWAVQSSDYLVADSLGIQSYLKNTYQVESTYIPYGALPFDHADEQVLKHYQLEAYQYSLLIARMEPENNIETIIEGYLASGKQEPLIIIGNHQNKFGQYLFQKFENAKTLRWMGAIYNMNHLDNLRHFSQLYFHGHSVGGTNPSLLEAMACQTQIIAHNNEFNRGILGDDAFYFNNSAELSTLLQTDSLIKPVFKTNNYQKILNLYPPLSITDQYEMLFKSCLSKQ